MSNFLFGVLAGIVLATVGFNGVAQLGNRAVQGIQSFTLNNAVSDH
jgi:hypothetical protein